MAEKKAAKKAATTKTKTSAPKTSPKENEATLRKEYSEELKRTGSQTERAEIRKKYAGKF